MFSQLVRYDVDGTPVLDVAESIEPNEDNTLWTVKLHQDRKFSDGTPVKAENFTRAWKLITSQNQTQASFFDSFEGTDEEGAGDLSGVEDVDDYTFTIKLKQPSYDLVSRLGYTAYAPLPDSTLDNPEAGGQKPVGNGPYKLASDTAWEHNVKVTLVPNENYVGDTPAQNEGRRLQVLPVDGRRLQRPQGRQRGRSRRHALLGHRLLPDHLRRPLRQHALRRHHDADHPAVPGSLLRRGRPAAPPGHLHGHQP